MISKRITTGVVLTASATILTGLLSFFGWTSSHPITVRVENDHQRVVAAPNSASVATTFYLRNLGRTLVTLGKAETSCGCSVASGSPTNILPGGKAAVTLTSTPPGAGSREIVTKIPLVANNAKPSTVELHLIVVGSTPIPYVASSTGPVRFGVLSNGENHIDVTLETREKGSDPPWLTRVSNLQPAISVKGSMTREVGFGEGVVVRTYHYVVNFESLPPAGDYSGEIVFSSATNPESPSYRLDYNAVSLPPVRVSPAKLYASIDAGDTSLPTFVLLFNAKDRPDVLLVTPLPSTLSRFEVAPIRTSTPGMAIQKLTLLRRPTETVEFTLEFKTNHPEAGIIRLPCLLRLP